MSSLVRGLGAGIIWKMLDLLLLGVVLLLVAPVAEILAISRCTIASISDYGWKQSWLLASDGMFGKPLTIAYYMSCDCLQLIIHQFNTGSLSHDIVSCCHMTYLPFL